VSAAPQDGDGDAFAVPVIAGDRGGQQVVTVRVVTGESVAAAYARSGLADTCGAAPDFAIFGVRVAADAPLRPGDRIEVLRPLLVDPKEARRRRAAIRRGGSLAD
jgi:putative ubiquitin-RnfH superfamily antitoxin RatB of RatAB toxin-antitoxin module